MLRKIATAAVPFALVALASLDCGGKLDTSLLPVCPSDGTCSSECKEVVTDCSGTHELACTCDSSGRAICPELGAPNCQNDCDALMQQQKYTCSIEGERCMAPYQTGCMGSPTLYCTCSSGQFVCEVPSDCPPPPACPPPDQVAPGATCYGFGMCDTNQFVYDCEGNLIGDVQCSCMNGTFGDCISPPTPPCAIDAGSADAWLTPD